MFVLKELNHLESILTFYQFLEVFLPQLFLLQCNSPVN